MGVVSFPIAFRFLPKLTSKGYALAKPLGLLITGYLFWLLTSLGVLKNDLGGVILVLLMLLAAAAVTLNRSYGRKLLDWVKDNGKTILVMELLFLGLFVFWAFVRAANPDVSYTEKPMELAFINSILKSPGFPPIDPWLSGYSISYYYFGYIIVSILIRLTGVASSIGFNLSSALWFAMSGLAAYGLVFDLVNAWKRRYAKKANLVDGTPVPKVSHAPGFMGPLFIVLFGNLEGVLEFLHAGGVFWKTTANGIATSKFWTWLSISELDVAPNPPWNWIPARTTGWLWWRGSRVLQDLNLTNGRVEIIDEFPFFSYLLSDLHPHVLAMPFAFLAMGLCLNLFLSASEFPSKWESMTYWFKKWEFWLTALILGSLAFINTWDFPIYIGLTCLVVTYLRNQLAGWGWRRFGEFIQSGLFLGVVGVVLYLPFYIGFKSQAGGLLPSLEYMTRGIHFWVMFGLFLIPIILWLVYHWRQKELSGRILDGLKLTGILFGSLFLLSCLYGILLFNLSQIGTTMANSSNAFIVNLGYKAQLGEQAFAGVHGGADVAIALQQTILRRLTAPGTWLTLGGMLVFTWALLSGKFRKRVEPEGVNAETSAFLRPEPDVRVFVLLLVIIGIALTTFPEFFYLRDQFGSRMNTIFKFYFQAWLFWGIAGAFACFELAAKLRRWKQVVFSIVLVGIFIGGLAYPTVMLWNKTNAFSPAIWTLDGNEFLSRYTPDDYAAMDWLTQAPVGVVAEAVGGSYTDYARVSARTGLPTVLGWPGHESQWRGGGEEMGSRLSDIQRLYSTDSWSEALGVIQQYGIRYIFVGSLETATYHPNLEKFRTMLKPVYTNSTVTIYEVPSEMWSVIQ
jgi:YYY domain-containing protein